jgi:hypothetical protein
LFGGSNTLVLCGASVVDEEGEMFEVPGRLLGWLCTVKVTVFFVEMECWCEVIGKSRRVNRKRGVCCLEIEWLLSKRLIGVECIDGESIDEGEMRVIVSGDGKHAERETEVVNGDNKRKGKRVDYKCKEKIIRY